MADGPAIYPTSFYPTGPLEKFVTGGIEGYGKAIDFQAKSDALSMQLLENSKKRQAAAERDKVTPGTTPGDLSSGYDGSTGDGGSSTTAGMTAGPSLQDGVGSGRDNWEILHNNFAGLRRPGVTTGPNAGGFQQFATPEQGVQAIANQLDRYVSGATTGKPLTTIRQIVSTWAPPNDKNPTEALIANASQVTGVDPNAPIDLSNPTMKAKMVEAMIRGEQGGYLHPNAAAAIPKVFGVQDFQPYRRQAAIGGTSAPSASAGAPPTPAAPSGGAPSGAPQTAQPLALVPRYDPATLMARPTAALGLAPAPPVAVVPPGAQTYAAPPQPPPVNYAALAQPQYALAPSNSGLFGQV